MNSYTYKLLGLLFLLGCTPSNDESGQLGCDPIDKDNIIGIWSEPMFVLNSSNCYAEECLEIEFSLNTDSTYQLIYQVSDLATDTIRRSVDDQGTFSFSCLESGNLVGRFSSLRYVRGAIVLNSDSLEQMKWNLEWSGVEGLIIQPEYLGFTHDIYVKLRK